MTQIEKNFKIPYYKWNRKTGIVRSLKTNKKVGMLKICVYDGYETEVYVDYLMVQESHQGKGLGRKFLNELIKQSKKNGIESIALYACPIGNQKYDIKKLQSFYRSFGFRSCRGTGSSDMMKVIK